MDILEELTNLISALKKENIDFALCGGLAMAVYAFPRATTDIDIMIKSDTLTKVKDVVKSLGFDIDSGLLKFKRDSIHIYRLCKIAPDSPEPLVLDLLLVTPAISEAWNSRIDVLWEKGSLPVASPSGLIQLKSLRGSGLDKDDIKHLKDLLNED
jgi:hypothetical protein